MIRVVHSVGWVSLGPRSKQKAVLEGQRQFPEKHCDTGD
jgi:hypothetical protein